MRDMGRGRGADDRGFTLVELLVTITIGLIVLGAVGTSVVTGQRTQREQTAHVDRLNGVKMALERITRDVRAADPLEVADAATVSMRVQRGTGWRTVTYRRAGDVLQVRSWVDGAPEPAFRPLITGLDAATTVFSYFDLSATPDPNVPLTAPVDIDDVDAVSASLRVLDRYGVTTISDRIALRNAGW